METRGGGDVRSVWRLVLMILFPALGVAGAHGALRAEQKAPPATAPAKEATKPAPLSDPYCRARFSSPFNHLIGEPVFEELRTKGAENVQAAQPSIEKMAGELTKKLTVLSARVDVDVVVASLPDPTTSGLGYQFDAQLEALVLGMEASAPSRLWSQPTLSYNRDRSWLPWSDLAVGKEQQLQSVACRHQWPGVVLFRAAGPIPSILVLLLVGESPISGVNVAAMDLALELAARMVRHPQGLPSSDAPNERAHPTRLLGPTFSGSATSLRRALDRHRVSFPEQRIQVISGTASGPDVPHTIDPSRVGADVSYKATTISGQDLVCSFLYAARRAGAAQGVGGPRNAVDGTAILRESGTEFGSTLGHGYTSETSADTCPLAAEIELSFPFHISAIRDAYEELDSSQRKLKEDPSIERHTALEISLRGGARLDLESPQSTVTKFSQDLALSNVLGEISREGVRWLGIQATDIADAIFLARKIRDVAPDVRLVFFTADALLTHPSFRADLLGSLVITPYPFLGSDDFWPRKRIDDAVTGIVQHSHASFANAEAEGSYNAVLALRGVPVRSLMEYAFIEPAPGVAMQPLPVWTAVVARTGIVPIRVAPARDCAGVIFGNGDRRPEKMCGKSLGPGLKASGTWEDFNSLRELELHVDPDVTPPRLWNFAFGLLLFGCLLHWWFDGHVDRELEPAEMFPSAIRMEGSGLKPIDADSRLDRCIVRSKWHLYALFAQLALSIAAAYFFAIYAIALTTYARHDGAYKLSLFAAGSLALLVFVAWRTTRVMRRTWGEIRAFARSLSVEGGALLRPNGLPGEALLQQFALRGARPPFSVVLLWLGFADARPLGWSVYVSYAQLRGMFWLGLCATVVFVLGLAGSLWYDTDLGRAWGDAVPALTLFALRSLPLTNGVSPAVPLLLAIGCAYWWAMGRMARLRVLHGLARMSPDDHVMDCVSTPIRAVLFPTHTDRHPADEGFTANERLVINQVLRPSGYSYLFAMLIASFLPLLLFSLKRPTTLEPNHDTYLLFAALGVSALLICATLVQMVNYWRALRCLLRRLMAHPIGGAFKRVPEPIRATLDVQVSRNSDDLQEVAACADAYVALFLGDGERMWNELTTRPFEEGHAAHRAQQIAELRRVALGQVAADGSASSSGERTRDVLGRAVLTGANEMVHRVLLRVWDPALPQERTNLHAEPEPEPPHGTQQMRPEAGLSDRQSRYPSLGPLTGLHSERPRRVSTPVPPRDDRFNVAVAAIQEPDHRAWLVRAETYVATVVAMLLLRHVRQFKYFLYTTTGCALMLLAAVASYPFEPHRALMLCMWLLIGAVVASSLWIYIQLDRDPLLSHLAGEVESAGKVTWNSALAQRVFVWFLLPIVSLLAAQYPGVARELAHILEPFMRVLQ